MTLNNPLWGLTDREKRMLDKSWATQFAERIIDRMPVRGIIRMKHMFGFKIGALNFRKLSLYWDSLDQCAPNPELA